MKAIMKVRIFCQSILIVAFMMQSLAFAEGRLEFRQIKSKVLADAWEVAERELSLYLPEEYNTSELAYPVLYLIHGASGNNRSLLRLAYSVSNELIEEGRIKPLIVVMPDLSRVGNSRNLAYEEYLAREIVLFMDTEYRTIPSRQGRAIAGHSRGGSDALYTSLAHPEAFSLVGTYAAGFYLEPPPEDLLKAHDQASFPLQFWVYVGRNDQGGNLARNIPLIDILIELGLPHVFVVDDGNHSNMLAVRLADSMEFFSKQFSGGIVPVQTHDKLSAMWGEVKSAFR